MEQFNAFIVCACLGAVFYVLVGYPLLLVLLARRSTRPVLKDAELRTVSIVVAIRNGEKFVAAKLRSILELNYPRHLMQIIVVSDGSTDSTDEIVSWFQSDNIEFYRLKSSGKAAALNKGIAYATGEILVLTDVRQSLAHDSLRNLVACFGDPEVGAASGELFIRPGVTSQEADTRLYWDYELFIRKRMSRIDSTFGANGPFYAIRRSLVVPIPKDTLLDDVYLPLSAFFRGYRIIVESTAQAFDYPTDLKSEFGRKVRTQAGLYQVLHQYPQLFSGSNRMRFHFLSAKFARLALPFLLILISIFSLGLPSPYTAIAMAAQGLFYSAALADHWIPEDLIIKKITSAICTFVVLVTAALMGCKILFVPPRKLWKETRVRLT